MNWTCLLDHPLWGLLVSLLGLLLGDPDLDVLLEEPGADCLCLLASIFGASELVWGQDALHFSVCLVDLALGSGEFQEVGL